MHTSFFTTALLAGVLTLTSCKKEQPSSQVSGVLVNSPEKFGLMQIIDRREFRVCLLYKTTTENEGASPAQIEEIKRDIKDAYKEWLTPLSAFFGKNLDKSVVFLDQSSGCKPEKIDKDFFYASQDNLNELNAGISDLSVVIHSSVVTESVSFHNAGKQWMRLNPTTSRTVTLHEVGHTLGLGDAYNFSGLQPISIMNKQAAMKDRKLNPKTNGHLYPDDIYSLKQAFCALHHATSPQKCAELPYHEFSERNWSYYPRLTKEGQQAFSLGVTAKDSVCQIKSGDRLSKPEKIPEIVSVSPGSGAEKAGLKAGMLILSLNGYPKTQADLEHAVLTASSADVSVTVRIRNSEGVCDTQDVKTFSLRLDSKDSPIKPTPLEDLTRVKESSLIGIDDVVVTTKSVVLADGTTIPQGVYFTVLGKREGEFRIQFFSKENWISSTAVKHAPFEEI